MFHHGPVLALIFLYWFLPGHSALHLHDNTGALVTRPDIVSLHAVVGTVTLCERAHHDFDAECCVHRVTHKPNDNLAVVQLPKIALPMLWSQLRYSTHARKDVQPTIEPCLLQEQAVTLHSSVLSGKVLYGPARLLRFAVNWKFSAWLADGKKFWHVSNKRRLDVLQLLQLLTIAATTFGGFCDWLGLCENFVITHSDASSKDTKRGTLLSASHRVKQVDAAELDAVWTRRRCLLLLRRIHKDFFESSKPNLRGKKMTECSTTALRNTQTEMFSEGSVASRLGAALRRKLKRVARHRRKQRVTHNFFPFTSEARPTNSASRSSLFNVAHQSLFFGGSCISVFSATCSIIATLAAATRALAAWLCYTVGTVKQALHVDACPCCSCGW